MKSSWDFKFWEPVGYYPLYPATALRHGTLDTFKLNLEIPVGMKMSPVVVLDLREVSTSPVRPPTLIITHNHETSIVTGTILANVIIGARLSGALLFGCPSLTSTWAEVDVQTSKARANWVAMGSFASSTPLRLGEAGVGQLVNIVHIVGTRCWSFRVSPLPSTRRGFLDNGQSSALLKQLLSPAIRFLLYFIHIHTKPYSQISYSGDVSIAYLDLIGLNYSRGLNGRE